MADITDPDELELISKEAPLPKIRELAEERRQSVIHVQEMSKNDERCPKYGRCPKCGNPLVNVEYYSTVKGKTTATDVNVDYQTMKKTVRYVTPYSDFQRHTAVFCAHCAHMKVHKIRTIGFFMVLGGILLTAVSFKLPLPRLSNGVAIWEVLIIICGLTMAYIGSNSIRKFEGIEHVKRGKPVTISNGVLSECEEMHDYASSLFIRTTHFKDIQRAEGTNAVVARGMVRNKNI